MLQRLDAAAKPGAEALPFDSCLTDQKSQLKCKQTYDAIDPDRRQEFMTRLHESLVTLTCEDTDIARGILRQIRYVRLRSSDGPDSTRIGLAAVLLARMKDNEPCPGLAGLSAEDKAELERIAKRKPNDSKRQRRPMLASNEDADDPSKLLISSTGQPTPERDFRPPVPARPSDPALPASDCVFVPLPQCF
ncbi:MAG: hypothetical protein R3F44_10020 [Candidatus Competibacteraceae bacterium]